MEWKFHYQKNKLILHYQYGPNFPRHSVNPDFLNANSKSTYEKKISKINYCKDCQFMYKQLIVLPSTLTDAKLVKVCESLNKYA